MTTNTTDIDDSLFKEAMTIEDIESKKEAVEKDLRLLVKLNQQKKLKDREGKLNWEGGLEEMRRD